MSNKNVADYFKVVPKKQVKNILSCTEAGKILQLTKSQVRELVEQNKLTNFGNEYRYMVSESEVKNLKAHL